MTGRTTAPRRASAAFAAAALAAALGCAQQGAPPGGPPDALPPVIVAVVPDSGSTGVRPKEVSFRFDEVVSEASGRAGAAGKQVLVSPYQGEPDVRWHRDALGVRIPGGWRDSTVYAVTLLPGVTDLSNNRLDSARTVVFSTAGPIPDTHVRGVVFDWAAGQVIRNALVQAVVPRAGDDSAVYVTRSDSSGRFTLPYVPAGPVLVRGVGDANSNYGIDRREPWDSARVTLRDSARVELYAFIHDSVGPQLRDVTITDSVTLRIELSRPLAPTQRIDTSMVTLLTSDSTVVAVASVLSRKAADSLAAVRDSIRRAADTTRARPDSGAARPAAPPRNVQQPRTIVPLPGARADSATDSTKRLPPPTMNRPVPVSALVVRLSSPLEPDARYRVRLNAVRGLDGEPTSSDRTITVPARDTTVRRDSSAVRDSTAGAPGATATPPPRVVPPPSPPPQQPPPDGRAVADRPRRR